MLHVLFVKPLDCTDLCRAAVCPQHNKCRVQQQLAALGRRMLIAQRLGSGSAAA